MGHGAFRRENKFGYGRWISHSGNVLGFSSTMWWKDRKGKDDADDDCVVALLTNVGTVHAGKVPSHSDIVVWDTKFLWYASQLAKYS
jgi:hypothetical protein